MGFKVSFQHFRIALHKPRKFTLIFVAGKLLHSVYLAADNKWLWFLQSEDLEEEQRIDQEVFRAAGNSDATVTG
jgi:hypothetical protein